MPNQLPPPIPHSYWVGPGRLCAGKHPGSPSPQYAEEAIRALLQGGIATFIDLTEAGEHTSYAGILRQEAARFPYPLAHCRHPIPDRHTPTAEHMVAILDVIDASLAAGRGVYVHCLAWIGRTGTVVGCYLARHAMAGEPALRALAYLRRGSPDAGFASPETEEQRRFVLAWRRGA
ncbi:hypothetical protein F8S13_24195 [Chloroflexia bacterium SDU3-3]|nr:hypothetical protein F8S13_24195 [Chloroflexia bacterium SDU3-3]